MTRYNSRPRKGRSTRQKAQVCVRTSLGHFARLSSPIQEHNTDKSSSRQRNSTVGSRRDSNFKDVKNDLKNAIRREVRAKNHIQLLREKSDVLCEQFSEACKARESMEKALGYLKSVVDTSSTEIVTLQDQSRQLERLTTEQSQELVRLSTELSIQTQSYKALENQNASMRRSRDALRKRLSRAASKIAQYEAHSNDEPTPTGQFLLKDPTGIIKSETRDMIRKLACEGVSTERASEVINIVAEGLGIDVIGTVSARSVARIMFEGLITARIQLAHELEQAKSIAICGDGTSIKNQQYEAKSTYIQLPAQDKTQLSLDEDKYPVYRTFGVQRAPKHTAKQQLNGWLSAIDSCCNVFSRSPFGQGSRISSKMVAPKLRGVLTDHASDQKRLHELLGEWKRSCDREARAISKLAGMSVEEQLNLLSQYLDSAGNGVKDWRLLSPEHQDAVMHDAWFALAAQIGEEEFQKLSPDTQFDIDFLAWAGCCMHKELNAVKGGVANMALAWKKLSLNPPIPLLNKYELDKARDPSLDGLARGAIKLTDLAGAVFNNKDKKKGYHSTVDGFFQKELGYSKRFPDTSHTRFGSHCDAATELVLHLELYRKLMQFLCDARPSQKFVNIEENIFKALHDIPTITELVVLSLYSQAVGRPYMRHVRSGTYNALELGIFHHRVKEYCKTIIENPGLLLAPDAVLTNATLDGQLWDQPEVIYCVLYRIPHLPNIQPMLVAFFEGGLKAWERFTTEFESDGIIVQATPEQRQSAWIPPTNDASEGALGQCRQMLRRAPTMSDKQRNARVMWPRHHTYEWKKQRLTEADEKFIRQEARKLDSSGVNQKLQEELHNAYEERVEANRVRQAKSYERRSKHKDKLALVEVREDASYEELLSMRVRELDLQIDKLREEGDKYIRAKSMVPNKQGKIKEMLAALERRRIARLNSNIYAHDVLETADGQLDQTPNDDIWPEDADMYFKNEVIL